MDESLEYQPGIPTGSPEATTAQPLTSNSDSDLHTVVTVLPMPTDVHADKAQAPATIGEREEGVPPPVATVEGSLLSTSAPPTGVSLPEDPPQLVNGHSDGHAPKKRKVAAPAIISQSISDK